MFGWLKGEPRCPVDPKAQAWLEGRVAWIVQEFGIERLREEVVLPNDDFFPDQYNGTEDDARRLFERVCEYMEVDPTRVNLRFSKTGRAYVTTISRLAVAAAFRGVGLRRSDVGSQFLHT